MRESNRSFLEAAGRHCPAAQVSREPAGSQFTHPLERARLLEEMLAAIRSVRARTPRELVVAIGVAPAQSITTIEAEADVVVCLYAPTDFDAVGQFFDDFSEVTDEMVVTALSHPVRAA